jgi:serine/threonine protein kinase/Tfp pilus assembly protein PilF
MPARTNCPDPSRLEAFHAATLPPEDEAVVIAHIDTCAVCRQYLDERSTLALFPDGMKPHDPPNGPLLESALLQALARLTVQAQTHREPTTEIASAPKIANDAHWHDDDPPGEPLTASERSLLMPSDDPRSLGRVGPYEVQRLIGRGGMGFVVKAHDPSLNRIVAIKLLAPALASDASARRRFAREAQAAAAVCHEYVVSIHSVAETDGAPYFVMQYIPGQSLQDKLDRNGPMGLKPILRIGMQIAAGLAEAHKQGLVHRDIKPSNILLENSIERVKITDFGLARSIREITHGDVGIVAGTPHYMSPEQAHGEPVDPRSDLFSLGSLLYAMCTGHIPFHAESTVAILRKVNDDEPEPVRTLNPDIPEWMAAIVAKLMAKDPAGRYQSAGEVADLLARRLAELQLPGGATTPERESPADAGDSSGSRWAMHTLPLVAVCLIGFAALGLSLRRPPVPNRATMPGAVHRAPDQPKAVITEPAPVAAPPPDDKKAFLRCGRIWFNKQDFQRAIDEFDRAIALDPEYFDAYIARGWAYASAKNQQRALLDFTRAVQLGPDNAWAYANRGMTYNNLGDWAHAIPDLVRALELEPGLTPAAVQLGKALREKGELDRSLEYCDKAIAMDPTYGWNYMERGWTYRARKEWDRAIADFQRAGQIWAINCPSGLTDTVLRSLGDVYRDKGELSLSLASLDEAIRRDGKSSYAHFLRGLTHEQLENWNLALRDFTRAIELKPGHVDYHRHRGGVYVFLGRWSEALADFTRAIEQGYEAVDVYEARSRARAGLGDAQGAKDDMEHAARLRPPRPR